MEMVVLIALICLIALVPGTQRTADVAETWSTLGGKLPSGPWLLRLGLLVPLLLMHWIMTRASRFRSKNSRLRSEPGDQDPAGRGLLEGMPGFVGPGRPRNQAGLPRQGRGPSGEHAAVHDRAGDRGSPGRVEHGLEAGQDR